MLCCEIWCTARVHTYLHTNIYIHIFSYVYIICIYIGAAVHDPQGGPGDFSDTRRVCAWTASCFLSWYLCAAVYCGKFVPGQFLAFSLVLACCRALQCVAVRCSVLQRVRAWTASCFRACTRV